MKAFWKVLGFAALAAGLTPYKVEKDEETGEDSYQALLYRLTIGPGSGDNKKKIDVDLGINLGEGTLTSKLMKNAGKAEEPHLFSDELSVEYTAPAAADIVEKAAEVAEEAAEKSEEAAEAVEEVVEEAAENAAEVVEAVEEAVEETVEAAEAEEPKAE